MRLSKITTRTGDKGTTGLADGTRLGKDHARIAVLGSVDELSSQLGVLLAEALPNGISAVLLRIQNDLFDLGGALALPTRDALFVLSRCINRAQAVAETLWRRDK